MIAHCFVRGGGWQGYDFLSKSQKERGNIGCQNVGLFYRREEAQVNAFMLTLVGGSAMLGFISAAAFSTILAVVAGLTLAGASAVSIDLYASVFRKRPADDKKGVRDRRSRHDSGAARGRVSDPECRRIWCRSPSWSPARRRYLRFSFRSIGAD